MANYPYIGDYRLVDTEADRREALAAQREAEKQAAKEKASADWDEAVLNWDVGAKLEGGILSQHIIDGLSDEDWDRLFMAVLRYATTGDATFKRILSNAKEVYMRHHSSGDAA